MFSETMTCEMIFLYNKICYKNAILTSAINMDKAT